MELMDKSKTDRLSPGKTREIAKRAARFASFFFHFGLDVRMRVSSMRKAVRTLIRVHEKHPNFRMHHKINRGNNHYKNLKGYRRYLKLQKAEGRLK